MTTDLHGTSGDGHRHLGRRLLSGSTWMVAMRFGTRGIGFISTVILARLLTPADFGIVAMSMLLISFVEVLTETGQQFALIQHTNPQREHYDTAWTMSALINTGLAVIVIAIAPLAPRYFHDPRIVPVIQVLSLRILLSGYVNIGVVDFRRHLDFAQEFRFLVFRKLLTFGVTLTLAFTLRNYWALVAGTALSSVLEVALSFKMHPYRPRPSLAKVRELWSYSIWLLVQSLGGYFEGRIDGFFVAGIATPANMGRYTVGTEIGELPISEVLDPIERALFPNYSRLKDDVDMLRRTYLQVLSIATAISAATSIGIALVAKDIVAVLLGPQWSGVAPLVVYFAIATAINGVCKTVYPILYAVGDTRASAFQSWLRAVLHLPVMIWAAKTGDIMNFAIAKPVIAIVLMPTYFFNLRRSLPISWLTIGKAMWRAPCAALIMTAVMTPIDFTVISQNALVRLPFETAVGGAAYIVGQLILWLIAGKPDGVERIFIDRVLSMFGRISIFIRS